MALTPAYTAKTETDEYYSPIMVNNFLDKVEAQIQEAIAEGNYNVTVGTESDPDIVVTQAIAQIQAAGYKTNKKTKNLTVMWDKAIAPEEPE